MRGKVNGRFSPARASKKQEEDDSGRWLGTYADAITLLMAFFVMLYAMSEVDVVKFEAFVSGLEGPFGNNTPMVFDTGAGIVGPGGSTPDIEPIEQAGLLSNPPAVQGTTEGDDQQDQQAQQDDAQLEAVKEAFVVALTEIGVASVADFRRDTRGLVVSIASDDVLFALGSAEVSPLGEEIVGVIADVLDGFPNDVVVEGHTDDLPIGRVDYSNWNLSTDRSVAVINLLNQEHGFAPDRLGAAGYGEFRPVAPNDSPANRARNRRVDVLVVAEGNSNE